jgi:hypothetical protein
MFDQGVRLLTADDPTTEDLTTGRVLLFRVASSDDEDAAPQAAAVLGGHLLAAGEVGEAEPLLRAALESGHWLAAPQAAFHLGEFFERHNEDLVQAQSAYRRSVELGAATAYGLLSMNRLGILLVRNDPSSVTTPARVEAERLFRTAARSGHPEAGPEGALWAGSLCVERGAVWPGRRLLRSAASAGHPVHSRPAAEILREELPPAGLAGVSFWAMAVLGSAAVTGAFLWVATRVGLLTVTGSTQLAAIAVTALALTALSALINNGPARASRGLLAALVTRALPVALLLWAFHWLGDATGVPLVGADTLDASPFLAALLLVAVHEFLLNGRARRSWK